MAVLLRSRPERSLTATAVLADAIPGDEASPARHPPIILVAAHGAFAMATILFATLAAIGR